VEGEKESSAVVMLLTDYKQALTGNTSLFEKLAVEFARQDTKSQNDLGIQVKMSDRFALALAYQVIYHSRPADGFEHYDCLTTANLVYNIK
jgi:putative salt-induced outer membrane protein